MKKKGQITTFVIVGLVIFTIIIISVYVLQSSVSGNKPSLEKAPPDVLNVEKYVTSCLNDALENAVSYCAGHLANGNPKCPSYETQVTERTKENFCVCIPECKRFDMFKGVEVKIREDLTMESILADDKSSIKVIMEYPLLVKKGENEFTFGTTESPFFAEYALKQSGCVPIKVDPNTCIAQETKTVEVLGIRFTYNQGDEVRAGPDCIAC